MEYTVENINALISSINNNSDTLKDMICQLKNNCSYLNYKLSEFAGNHTSLNNTQIDAYQSYLSEYNRMTRELSSSKELLSRREPIAMLSDISSIITFCNSLMNLHHGQLEIIDRLCSLLQKSNDVVSLIA